MATREGTAQGKASRAAIAVWAASALAVAAAVVWVIIDTPRGAEPTVAAAALPGLLPTEAEMAALLPRARVSRETNSGPFALGSSPGFLGSMEQSWGTNVSILVAIFASPKQAVQAHARWMTLTQVPWHEVRDGRIGERCRYQPQGGWSMEFFRANVYVMVSTHPGDEGLAREVARLLDTKIARASAEP